MSKNCQVTCQKQREAIYARGRIFLGVWIGYTVLRNRKGWIGCVSSPGSLGIDAGWRGRWVSCRLVVVPLAWIGILMAELDIDQLNQPAIKVDETIAYPTRFATV